MRVEKRDTRFNLSIYNLANVAPRQTATLNLAADDVEMAYQAILHRVAKAGGRIVLDTHEHVDHMSEDDGGPMYEAGAVVDVQPWTLVLLLRTSWRPRPAGTDANGE